jgi:hypothetical protein
MAEETPVVAPPAAPVAPWFEAFEPEVKGYLQNRGLDKLDPAQAVLKTIEAHRAAEKRLGAPADELVRFPKDPNDAAWQDVFKRLGKPDAPTGYDFSPLSPADKPLDAELVSSLQAAAHKANMAPGQVLELTQAFLKHQETTTTKAATEASFKAAAEAEALKVNWGANFDTNLFVARRAAEVLGLTPEAITALEKSTSYASTMETMRKLGVAMGEARVIQGQGPQQTGAMSADQASARLADLKNDSAWVEAWANGGAEQKREFEQLVRIVTQAKMGR